MLIAYIIMGMTAIIAGSSLFAFTLFLYNGPFNPVSMNLDKNAILLVDGCLSLLFFIQHSGMVRRPLQRFLARIVPDGYAKPIYVIASGLVLWVTLMLWRASPDHPLVLGGVWRFLLRTVFFLSLFGMGWGVRSLGSYDPSGIRQAIDRISGKPTANGGIVVRGPYAFVRHPLYLATILMIWSNPDITADRLLFNILWTIWILVATKLEESDLTAEYGDAYRDYQKRVPMFVPGRRAWLSSLAPYWGMFGPGRWSQGDGWSEAQPILRIGPNARNKCRGRVERSATHQRRTCFLND